MFNWELDICTQNIQKWHDPVCYLSRGQDLQRFTLLVCSSHFDSTIKQNKHAIHISNHTFGAQKHSFINLNQKLKIKTKQKFCRQTQLYIIISTNI